MVLVKQVAFSQNNLTALASGSKETIENIDRFQPTETIGRQVSVKRLQLSFRGNYKKALAASKQTSLSLECQVSTSAKFGQKDNVLMDLLLALTRVQVTEVAVNAAAHDSLALGDGITEIIRIPYTSAIYMHLQIWNLDATDSLSADECMTGASLVIWYDYV